MFRSTCLFALVLACAGRPLDAQAARAPTQRLTVFLDCRTWCDSDFARTEITYVDWVRDRVVADVHLLLTAEDAAAGGRAMTLAFIGQRVMAGRGDTLHVLLDATMTDDDRRRAVVKMMSLGLLQFVARTTAARSLQLRVETPAADAPAAAGARRDPWNFWVFQLGLNGAMRQERLFTNKDVYSDLTASRTTEDWKVEVELSLRYDDVRATVEDVDSTGAVVSQEVFTNLQRNWEVNSLVVRSLSAHWSAGLRTGVESNTYRNQRQRTRVASALEYDLFPYSESTRRRLTAQYGVGYDVFRYREETIFDRMAETLPMQYLQLRYRTRQPWGSTHLRVEHRNYLNDASKRNTEVRGDVDVRLFRGFGLRAGGGYSWIRDQLYLAKGTQETADVLLRRRALLTGFESHAYVGLSYTFGSIYNNVVNSRF
jgi:hypothetical protein